VNYIFTYTRMFLAAPLTFVMDLYSSRVGLLGTLGRTVGPTNPAVPLQGLEIAY
jgi:hypothetical protein